MGREAGAGPGAGEALGAKAVRRSVQPFVSVIIPTYNRRDILELVLRSLAQQTYPPEKYEVIVVDDGSEDRKSVV